MCDNNKACFVLTEGFSLGDEYAAGCFRIMYHGEVYGSVAPYDDDNFIFFPKDMHPKLHTVGASWLNAVLKYVAIKDYVVRCLSNTNF